MFARSALKGNFVINFHKKGPSRASFHEIRLLKWHHVQLGNLKKQPNSALWGEKMLKQKDLGIARDSRNPQPFVFQCCPVGFTVALKNFKRSRRQDYHEEPLVAESIWSSGQACWSSVEYVIMKNTKASFQRSKSYNLPFVAWPTSGLTSHSGLDFVRFQSQALKCSLPCASGWFRPATDPISAATDPFSSSLFPSLVVLFREVLTLASRYFRLCGRYRNWEVEALKMKCYFKESDLGAPY